MFPCVSLTSTDDLNHFQSSTKTQQLLRKSRTRPPSNGQKNTHRPQTRINSDQNTQFGLFSVVGWVWQHQDFTKRQEQANLSLLRGKEPARPRMRAENAETCNPDHWEMDFDLCESSAELPQKTRNTHVSFPATICLFDFFKARKWIFRDARLPQNTAPKMQN